MGTYNIVINGIKRTFGVLKPARKTLSNDIPITNPSAKIDTFVKSQDNIIPSKLQKILDDCGPHESTKKDFLTDLYSTGQDKFEFIYNHKYFKGNMPYCNDKEFIAAVKEMSPKELKQTFDEISDLYTKLPQVSYGPDKITKKLVYQSQTPNATNLAQLTILKAHNKEAYEYLLNHPDKKKLSNLLSVFSKGLNGSTFETLTIPQIRQIEGVGTASTLNLKTDIDTILKGNAAMSRYVESSDLFAKNADDVKTLHNYLSRIKVTEPFTTFRAERDTGMFNTILLDKKLALETKWNVLKNMLKARKIPVHDYTGNYDTAFTKKTNLFNFILGKENISLADAMQVAKFGNESYRNKIIELIKKSQINDSRFKSLTFDRKMAEGWLPAQGSNNTGILHNVTINKGVQGSYSSVNNRQAEFILNNNDKRMSFQDVKYDPKKDIFVLNTTIE